MTYYDDVPNYEAFFPSEHKMPSSGSFDPNELPEIEDTDIGMFLKNWIGEVQAEFPALWDKIMEIEKRAGRTGKRLSNGIQISGYLGPLYGHPYFVYANPLVTWSHTPLLEYVGITPSNVRAYLNCWIEKSKGAESKWPDDYRLILYGVFGSSAGSWPDEEHCTCFIHNQFDPWPGSDCWCIGCLNVRLAEVAEYEPDTERWECGTWRIELPESYGMLINSNGTVGQVDENQVCSPAYYPTILEKIAAKPIKNYGRQWTQAVWRKLHAATN